MLDIHRELDELTSAATRGLPVPPIATIRRRARHVRRVRAATGALVLVAAAGALGIALADMEVLLVKGQR